MHAIIKSVVLSVAVAATALTAMAPASADDWGHRRHHHNRDGVAIGAAGIAAGVLLGSALASRPRYVEQEPVYVEPEYQDEVPVYRPRNRVVVEDPEYYAPARDVRPWSQAWRRYCTQRYRSFDPSTGTYVGYDGQEHFCAAGG